MNHPIKALLLALALLGCGGEASTETAPPAVLPTGVAPPVAPAPPGSLALGAPPVALDVPGSPGLTFTVAAPGEYQIDVVGADAMDAQLLLFMNGSYSTMDGDGGEGVNARLVQFLAPGNYEVRPTEWRHRALSASVSLTVLAPLTPAGAITPGAPPIVVNAPAGDHDRASSAEVTLTVAAAGTVRLDAVAAAGCDSQMVLIQNGGEVTRDSDSGEENNAMISWAVTPGVYTVRVYDWVHRACTITVSATPVP